MTEDKNVLVITRIFDAPVEMVWKYFSDAEMLKEWWGPENFTAPNVTLDFREGGKYLFCMRGKAAPDAPESDFWSTGTYKEIVPMKKIVYTDSFADKDGNIVSAEQYGMKGFPKEVEVTFEFEDLGDKTKFTLRHAGIANIDDTMRSGMKQGWNESLDKIVNDIAR